MLHNKKPSRRSGIGRLTYALSYQYAGVKKAIEQDASIRLVLIIVALLVVVSMLLPIGRLERLILVCAMLLVVLVEFLNSAIEAVVDRISTEYHPLSGYAKDLSSVTVAISVLIASLCWAVIVAPVAIEWLSQWLGG